MKQILSLATLVIALGGVHLTRAALADGSWMPAGVYQVRVTDQVVPASVGQSQGAERWVEFLQDGKVVGREVATVISAADMGAIAKGARPARNGSLVQILEGGDYLRVWINRDAVNYLINMPTGKSHDTARPVVY
jgi:hypothetical protein